MVLSPIALLPVEHSAGWAFLAASVDPEVALIAYTVHSIPVLVRIASCDINTGVSASVPQESIRAGTSGGTTVLAIPILAVGASLALAADRVEPIPTLAVDTVEDSVVGAVVDLVHFLADSIDSSIPVLTYALVSIPNLVSSAV